VLFFYGMSALRARNGTLSAPDAFILVEKKLRGAFLRFRIVAPRAT
jgi:hypothetical protein